MNKKIKDLAEQSGIAITAETGTTTEKFANLIIDECVDAVKNTNKHHALTTYELNQVESTMEKSIHAIKERFK